MITNFLPQLPSGLRNSEVVEADGLFVVLGFMGVVLGSKNDLIYTSNA